MFSKACEYGIRASIYISRRSDNGERVSLKEVAKAIESPTAFTAKILQSLAKDHIISSSKGPNGGYAIDLAKDQNISLLHIVKAIDGDKTYNGCGLGLKSCNEKKPCPLHDHFKSIRDELKLMLTSTSIKELADGLKSGSVFLKR